MPVWQRLVEPVAAHIADAMEGALSLGGDDDRGRSPGWPAWSRCCGRCSDLRREHVRLQLGQGLGKLATEVVGATDIGLPLSEPGQVALLPTNIAAFGEGLEQSGTDVTLYLALRESARQRLFAHAGWLREQVLALVEQYARGITIDTCALEEAVGQLDPNNLEELGEQLAGRAVRAAEDPGAAGHPGAAGDDARAGRGLGGRRRQPATAHWMPSAGALAETVRRRPRHRRARRGDLRDPGRPRAAAAPDA